MDVSGLTRDRRDKENGDIHLLLAGPEGGISLIAIRDQGHVLGCIGIHSPEPMYEGQRASECHDFGDTCYADITWTHGGPLAALLYDGREDAVWAELETWYAERFASWRA